MNIIITGASSGIGFEAVIDLVLKGHRVLALARSTEKLETLSKICISLNPDAQIYCLPFDIVNGNYDVDLIPVIQEIFPKIDILVNNAGTLVNKPFADLSPGDFSKMFQTNFFGHVMMIQKMLPHFNEQAHIVNIGSMGGYQGSSKFPGLAAYSASKAALHNLTECLAEEFKDRNIKVNCLALGSAQTEMLEEAFPGYQSPVTAFDMGEYIAHFALTGHKIFNGKVLPIAVTTP
ncbi:SDR family NAD(P)-dependent oxidoreductase [Solitalea koreensis]|uniref:Short-chain dehydrogenase n=1 Tax=Solitalea koreensis TaxID=543615 RepID=A0A521EB90_9SPHI|nr:SDR family NAD(P)-dependent oxidoreductase [Solitalea koreensis]SMO81194.1 Short-chain dehydrogenase [Solitalea koreensis]